MTTLTRQEQLFFQRVRLKMDHDATLTIEQALKAVCQDDRRIFEQYIALPDRTQLAFYRAFAESVYHTIRAEQEAP